MIALKIMSGTRRKPKMKKYLLAAVTALAMGGTAMAQPASAAYEARAQLSGFLMRAGMVCREQYDWQAMARAGIDLLYRGNMGAITNGYPATVKAWGTQGANLFNNGVMTDGVDAACTVAARDVAKARAIIARD
jgi:hypothetical protein